MTSAIVEGIEALARELEIDLKHEGSRMTLSKVLAERKVFLTKKKLTYVGRINVDDSTRTIKLSELLKETGSGIGGGEPGATPGFGFKKETYRTTRNSRSGTEHEMSHLPGSKYEYRFDYSTIRSRIEAIGKEAGYSTEYRLLSK